MACEQLLASISVFIDIYADLSKDEASLMICEWSGEGTKFLVK
ncbi:MAG: hypothetical protein EZS28_053840, partial [Streblomastix strix]